MKICIFGYLPKCEGPNKDGPGYGGRISPKGSGGRGNPGENNPPWPARSKSAAEGLLLEISAAPGGGLPKTSDEDGFPPPDDGVERLDGFMLAVVVLAVEA